MGAITPYPTTEITWSGGGGGRGCWGLFMICFFLSVKQLPVTVYCSGQPGGGDRGFFVIL